MKKYVKTKADNVGVYYEFNGRRATKTNKPTTYNWYMYCGMLHILKESNPGMHALKVSVAQRYFLSKGEEYANILRHIEDTIPC